MNEELESVKRNLKLLKLYCMENVLEEELASIEEGDSSFLNVFQRLLEMEVSSLIERRMERRIKESKLPDRKLLSDFDFEFQTGVNKKQIVELSTLAFVERKQGLILAGNSGTGKSHIAKALLLIGCQKLYRCRYTTAADMLRTLLSGLADDSLDQKLRQYMRPEILFIDEVGFDRLEQESSRNAALFFKVIDSRYCKGSTLMTTNVDFKELGEYLGDPVITTSIVDRMVHHSIIIHIEGPSYRIHESEKLNHAIKRESKR